MANSNFVVHNGLTVGPLTIDAATGNITTSGNITSTGTQALSVSNGLLVTNAFTGTFGDGTVVDYSTGNARITTGSSDGLVFRNNGISSPVNLMIIDSGGNVLPGQSNVYSLGTNTSWWKSAWTIAVNAQYADLAENYVADAAYEPGTVVHFGGANEVTSCDKDMCTRVAGVVSTNPAYLMNAVQEGENIVPVALTGRVPTKVTGTVQKGDMMVSAGNGRARAEANPKVGSVIGKALENSEGDAVIEVVIGKH